MQHYEIDNFVWTRHIAGDIRKEAVVRDQLIEEDVKTPYWVIEGVYIDWKDKELLHADQIIFLDIPSRV